MRVTMTGATGLIGKRLIGALQARGDEVTVLTRSPDKAKESLPKGVKTVGWSDPTAEPAPTEALKDADAVIHLAGESVSQRWNDDVKRRIADSRELGTRNLVAGIRAAGTPPKVLASASATGYYGPRGAEAIPEPTPPGTDFLARVCVTWEEEAQQAPCRTVCVRTGIVLDADGGALAKMLPPFKLGVGGPIAGGEQYMPWIAADDLVGIYLQAVDDTSWAGPVNGSAPNPVTNAEFSKTLGKILHRPAFAPVPGFAVKMLFGDMAVIVSEGQRAIPQRTQELGYTFEFATLEPALKAALDKN